MIPQQICKNCGTTTDYIVVHNGPHNEAICIKCGSHIKFISKKEAVMYYAAENQKPANMANKPATMATNLNNMANGLWGSICIDDLFNGQVMQGQDGRKWVCLDGLQQDPFQKSDKNGKHYVKVQIWINDEPDQFQNNASISLSQSKEQREAGQKRVYIGNLKWNQQQQQAAPQGYAQHPGYPAPQPAYPAPQPAYQPQQQYAAPMPPAQGPVYGPAPAPQAAYHAPAPKGDLPF